MVKRLWLMIAAALALSAPALALEQKSTGKADREFLADAASAGLMEVELGRIVQHKASSLRVKEFGQRMVTDHSKANEDLKQLATRQGITLPAKMKDEHRRMVERLSKLHGAEFDRSYMQEMLHDHQKDVEKFRKEAESAEDPDVRDFAAKTLPTLEAHLQMAKDVSGGTGRATSGARRHER